MISFFSIILSFFDDLQWASDSRLSVISTIDVTITCRAVHNLIISCRHKLVPKLIEPKYLKALDGHWCQWTLYSIIFIPLLLRAYHFHDNEQCMSSEFMELTHREMSRYTTFYWYQNLFIDECTHYRFILTGGRNNLERYTFRFQFSYSGSNRLVNKHSYT